MRTAAFTLVELSIVLVIIGLIVGGVLVGKEMIHGAEIRKTITTVDRIKEAVTTFRVKYNCLPGDCPNASQFLSNVCDGSGDGSISDPWGGWNYQTPGGCAYTDYSLPESAGVWPELQQAGLYIPPGANGGTVNSFYSRGNTLSTSAPDIPKSPIGTSGYGATSNTNGSAGFSVATNGYPGRFLGERGLAIMLGAIVPWSVNSSYAQLRLNAAPAMTPADAYDLDTKADDGAPAAGKVRGGIWSTVDPFGAGAVCRNGTAYDLTRTENTCLMTFAF